MSSDAHIEPSTHNFNVLFLFFCLNLFYLFNAFWSFSKSREKKCLRLMGKLLCARTSSVKWNLGILSIYLFYLSIFLSNHLSFYLIIFVANTVYPSINLSIYLPIHSPLNTATAFHSQVHCKSLRYALKAA